MRIIISIFVSFLTLSQASAQVKKYKAVVNVLGSYYKGDVFVDLTGENKEMIKINFSGTIDTGYAAKFIGLAGKKSPSVELGTSVIVEIIIAKDTFQFYDLLDTYQKKDESNRLKNCFVKKIAGKGNVRLYEWKNSAGEVKYYVAKPNEETLLNIHHPVFDDGSSLSLYFAFKSCKKMEERFIAESDQNEKYPFYKLTTTDEKLKVWKKLIEEYDLCKE